MFPNKQTEIQKALSEANRIMSTANEGNASQIARDFGITEDGINSIYNNMGKSNASKTVLGLLGMTPEQLRSNALSIISKNNKTPYNGRESVQRGTSPTRFPRLK